MNATLSGSLRDPGTIDGEHLRLLAIFHFVAAGMAFLGLLFVLGHYAVFHFIFSNSGAWDNAGRAGGLRRSSMAIFRWVYVVFGCWFLISAVGNILSGLFMRARRHRVFSLIVAAINCVHIPLGTLLGVFTFVVADARLGREVVRFRVKAALALRYLP